MKNGRIENNEDMRLVRENYILNRRMELAMKCIERVCNDSSLRDVSEQAQVDDIVEYLRQTLNQINSVK